MKNIRILMVVMALSLFVSCTRRIYVPVETVRTEYKDNAHEVRTTDSVTDTRLIYIQGDTVRDYHERIKWRERQVHDSLYINRVDTIRVPYPVESNLTKWQQTKMDMGGIAIGVLCLCLLVIVIYGLRRIVH